MEWSLSRILFAAALAATIAPTSSAQCLDWKAGFESTGTQFPPLAFAAFDDGAGPALYAATYDTNFPLESTVSKWDGEHWTEWAAISVGEAHALCVFDDGTGPGLYAAGTFAAVDGVPASCIAKWNGTTWSALGPGLSKLLPEGSASVEALAVYDDGTGPALYAGGYFGYAGATYVPGIAKWNGTSWSTVGGGTEETVLSLTVFDDGGGESVLVAGGYFAYIGGATVNCIAKWNGTSWSALGSGTSSSSDAVGALTTYDDGSGVALYAGGFFSTIGGTPASNVARWNGSAWSALGSGTDGGVVELTVFDDGGGTALHAVGRFVNAGGVSSPHVAKWNGSTWSYEGFDTGTIYTFMYTAVGFDDGSGPALFVGGDFSVVDGVVMNFVAKRQGSVWSPVPVGLHGLRGTVQALATFDSGAGAALYAGGVGAYPGPTRLRTSNLTRWNGSSWDDVPVLWVGTPGLGSNPEIYCLTVADDGSGPALFAGGRFGNTSQTPNVARYDGSTWTSLGTTALGTGQNSLVNAIASFDDGSGTAIFAGGAFAFVGSVSASRIAKWNGTSWAALGSGLGGTGFGGVTVSTLAVFDDGSGSALYAGGKFTLAGGASANRIARWNGTSWSALAGGMQGNGNFANVAALAVFDDGTGPALYAAGLFPQADGNTVNSIARWDGSTWTALGTGVDGQVYALYVFDDGTGPQLFAGGSFANAGGVSASGVARWNGTSWAEFGGGIRGFELASVRAFSAFNDAPSGNPDLFVGGAFTSAGAQESDQIAQWLGCGPGVPYCSGDGLDLVVTAQCPCSNFGKTGHGCGNSLSPSGGLLIATGTTNPNTVLFTVGSVPNNALATGFSNATNTNPGGVVFGDGVRCQSGALVRFGSHDTGTLGDAPNTWSAPAFPIAPGLTRYYQIQYRNSAPAFCPPGTFNITNGYRIVW